MANYGGIRFMTTKDRWTPINPAVAATLDWSPDPQRVGAWRGADGELRVATAIWAEGYVGWPSPDFDEEPGFGSYLVAAPLAVEELAGLAGDMLAGLKERIANVSRDGVRPSLRIDVREIPTASSGTDGYVVAIVPASPDRPHEADASYWGRSGAGKVKLRHEEVERYRAERTATHSTIEAILGDWVARDPTPATVRHNAHVFVVAEPVLGIPNMLDATVGASWQRWLHERVVNALVGGAAWSPDIAEAFAAVATVDGYALRGGDIAADGTVGDGAYESGLIELHLTVDGGVRIFAARGSDTSSRGKTAVEGVIVGLAYRAAQVAAVISQECDFRGDWDFGLAVTDLRGAISSEALHDLRFGMVAGPYPEAGYRASTRATAGEVASAPLDIATRLTDRLNRVLNDRRFVFGKRG